MQTFTESLIPQDTKARLRFPRLTYTISFMYQRALEANVEVIRKEK